MIILWQHLKIYISESHPLVEVLFPDVAGENKVESESTQA